MKNIHLSLYLILLSFSDSISQTIDYHTSKAKQNYNKTIITPYLFKDQKKDTNIIYCSTFQIAWNELNKIIGEDVELSKDLEIVEKLNSFSKYDNTISNGSLSFAGILSQELINSINNEISRKYNNSFDSIKYTPDNQRLIILSYLLKDLPFRKSFLNQTLWFNGDSRGKEVKAFGISKTIGGKYKSYFLASQFNAYYLSDNNFIVKLKNKNNKDEIILAMVPTEIETDSLIDIINNKYKDYTSINTHNVYSLSIPKIELDVTKKYYDLIGQYFKNKSFQKWQIIEAEQSILLRLNEKGAELRSKALLLAARGASKPLKKNNYTLNFNKPFYIILKEKRSCNPYFIMWVANSDLMLN